MKRRKDDCDARGLVTALVRKNITTGMLEVKCPRCGQWQILPLGGVAEDAYNISKNGLVTPDFVCMASNGRHCDFTDTIVLEKT